MKNLRIVLLALLLMAVLGTAWWFVLNPNNEKNAEMEAKIDSMRNKLQDLNKAQGMAGDLQREIDSYEEAIGWFRDKLPLEKQIDMVLREIWMLARQNDLAPKSVKPLERPASGKGAVQMALPEFCAEQPIILELEGDFPGFYRFLQAVETQPRIMRVTNMELTRDDRKLPATIKATLAMSIYFEKPVKPAAPAATPAGRQPAKTKGT